MTRAYEYNKTWRQRNPDKRYADKKNYYARGRDGDRNSGNRWTSAEMDLAMDHSISDRELAQKLGRSIQAVQVKRAKMVAAEKAEA